MTKIFISQPMNGKTDDAIFAERSKCRDWLLSLYDNVSIIDNFITIDPPKELENEQIGVWYLGKSLEKLAQADTVVMLGNYQNARGCLMEKMVAEKYGIPVIVAEVVE